MAVRGVRRRDDRLAERLGDGSHELRDRDVLAGRHVDLTLRTSYGQEQDAGSVHDFAPESAWRATGPAARSRASPSGLAGASHAVGTSRQHCTN